MRSWTTVQFKLRIIQSISSQLRFLSLLHRTALVGITGTGTGTDSTINWNFPPKLWSFTAAPRKYQDGKVEMSRLSPGSVIRCHTDSRYCSVVSYCLNNKTFVMKLNRHVGRWNLFLLHQLAWYLDIHLFISQLSYEVKYLLDRQKWVQSLLFNISYDFTLSGFTRYYCSWIFNYKICMSGVGRLLHALLECV